MPLTIERRGAQWAVRVPPEPDARDETGRPLYVVDTAALAGVRGAQRALRDGWGLEPHGSVPDSETEVYFRPVEAQPRVEISRWEWDELRQRVAWLEQVWRAHAASEGVIEEGRVGEHSA